MTIGDRLHALREERKFSQGDIEKRTGLLRAISLALRMAIPSQRLNLWRSCHAL
jgi:transcriptional regulator with XRE-family HTH domain